jgi:hypothetical protein
MIGGILFPNRKQHCNKTYIRHASIARLPPNQLSQLRCCRADIAITTLHSVCTEIVTNMLSRLDALISIEPKSTSTNMVKLQIYSKERMKNTMRAHLSAAEPAVTAPLLPCRHHHRHFFALS